MMSAVVNRKNQVLQDPPFAQVLFSDPRAGWFWLIVRVWLGWQWIEASLHKINNPAWTQTGEAVKGFWTNAVAIPEVGRPAISFDWYRSFLQMMLDNDAYTWMAPLIAYGELLIGIGLIVGAFTGIAAFFGALLNWNFMMAGTASSSPLLMVLAVGLILAWKVAGYVGLDFFLLRFLGTPWRAAPPATVNGRPVTA
ncbi:MAG: DoxX family membrane protein [Caldilineaceae bacterium]|nr:DoxX family membrane protein [Caldilineaceae bacterium]